jgi:hypothetical protein
VCFAAFDQPKAWPVTIKSRNAYVIRDDIVRQIHRAQLGVHGVADARGAKRKEARLSRNQEHLHGHVLEQITALVQGLDVFRGDDNALVLVASLAL